jgi:hypothetical protein
MQSPVLHRWLVIFSLCIGTALALAPVVALAH